MRRTGTLWLGILLMLAGDAPAVRTVDLTEAGLARVDLYDHIEIMVNQEYVSSDSVSASFITANEVDDLLIEYLTSTDRDPAQLTRAEYDQERMRLIAELERELLLLQEARRWPELRVPREVLTNQVEEHLRQERARYEDPAQFEAELRAAGSSLSEWQQEWQERLERRILVDNYVQAYLSQKAEITEETVAQFKRNNPDQVQRIEWVALRHILLRLPVDAGPELVARREQEMKAIRARLEHEDFGRVAQEVSEDELTRAQGGDLGRLRHGQWPEAEEAFLADVGMVLGPIGDRNGLHLVQVQAKYLVRDELLRQRRDDVFRRHLADLREDAQIVRNPRPYESFVRRLARLRQWRAQD